MKRLLSSVSFITASLLFVVGCGSSDTASNSTGASPATSESAAISSAAIDSNASKLEGDAKTLYESALAAEPFPDQADLITGKFHGEFKDGAFESYYEYERRPDGTLTHVAVDMYGDEKEYLRTETAIAWKSEGRVIYEQDIEDPESIFFLVLQDVSESGLKYKMIDPGFGSGEVTESEDLRGSGELPEMPDGWTEVDE